MTLLTILLIDILAGMEFDLFVPSFPELKNYFRLIISDSYPIQKQQVLMSILNGAQNTSVALAPVIGSFITKIFHWEGNFITLLILGLITFIMTCYFIPNYPLSKKLASFFSGYAEIFKIPSLILLIIYFIILFVPYWIFVGISPLLYIESLKVSLNHFGLYQGSLALTFAIGSFIFSFIVMRFDQKKMLLCANYIFMFSFVCILYITFSNQLSPLVITLGFIPFIIGQIIPTNILYPLYLNLIPEAKGKLSALVQGGRLIFASLGLQMAGYFYQGNFYPIGIIVSMYVLLGMIIMMFILKSWAYIQNP